MTVLGISPGTRSVGIAIIKNKELVDWRIKDFSGPWSNNKLNIISDSIKEIIIREKVNSIGIKLTPKERSSKMLNGVECKIIDVSIKAAIRFKTYSILDLKLACKASSNKYFLAEYLTEKYPFLKKEFQKLKASKKIYYHKLFEAIATAHIQI